MDFVVELEYKPSIPLYRRLSDALRKAILEGRLAPGQPMPSVRDLSSTLRISRATVLKCFNDLCSQSYLVSVKGAGTFVNKKLPGELADILPREKMGEDNAANALPDVEFSAFGQRALASDDFRKRRKIEVEQINFGGPPLELTPLNQWRQLLLRHCRMRDLSPLAYSVVPFGYPPLQEALAAYLHRARAVRCSPQQVVIGSSKQFRLDIPARLLLNPGDFVAFEEPGYPEARLLLAAHGANIVPIPVDNEGLSVEYLASLNQKFKLVYVTPSHQDPTGVTMSLSRRKELLSWAHRTGTFIIEDDYDSEYRYGSKQLPSLQGLDSGDCVIYLSSLWKILFPIVRMGFLVIPKRLAPAAMLVKVNTERDLPLLEQFALTDFINDGHLERHIKRTTAIYAKRRQVLIHALTVHLKDMVKISPDSAGMHILVHVESSMSTADLLKAAARAEVPAMSTKECYLSQKKDGELIIAFAHVHEERLEKGIKEWAALIKGHHK
jgi:GntR family transcriptional regulator / MocR family aminotransferase